jgi:hypothetical protein
MFARGLLAVNNEFAIEYFVAFYSNLEQFSESLSNIS